MRTDTGMQAFERAWAEGDQYVTRVNKGGLDVERHTDYLNKVYGQGFALHSIFEQNGNTVMIFERRSDAILRRFPGHASVGRDAGAQPDPLGG